MEVKRTRTEPFLPSSNSTQVHTLSFTHRERDGTEQVGHSLVIRARKGTQVGDYGSVSVDPRRVSLLVLGVRPTGQVNGRVDRVSQTCLRSVKDDFFLERNLISPGLL